jgi:hypothetical protein
MEDNDPVGHDRFQIDRQLSYKFHQAQRKVGDDQSTRFSVACSCFAAGHDVSTCGNEPQSKVRSSTTIQPGAA